MKKISKIEIAIELLESALIHYFESNHYFSSIQCAGAAEEILGSYVKINGGVPSFEKSKEIIKRAGKILNGKESKDKNISYIINYAKNSTKHMDGAEDDTIIIDSKDEANDLLIRCINNFYYLKPILNLVETSYVKKFNNEET